MKNVIQIVCYGSTKDELNYIKNELSDSFLNAFKYSNLRVIKCYSKLFIYQGFFKNYANWMMLLLILFFIIIIIFFFFTGLSHLLSNIYKEMNILINRQKSQKNTFEMDEYLRNNEEKRTNNPPKKSKYKNSEKNNFTSSKNYNKTPLDEKDMKII